MEKPDKPLTRAETEAIQRRLSMLSEPAVRDAYRDAHQKCCLGPGGRGELPKAADVQQFLSAWKVLWRWQQDARR